MHSRKSLLLLFGASLVTIALFASACGSSGAEASGVSSGVEGVPDGAFLVDQHSLKFDPKSLTVKAGQEIYFKNSETALHTVTIDGKNESGTMKGDAVFEWTFPGPGQYKITCDFHPQMKATITVE